LYPNITHSETWNYQQAINETLEVFRIDLSNYVLRLPASHLDMLIPPRAGLYLNGSIEPFFHLDGEGYYSLSTVYKKDAVPDIYTFEDVWRHRGTIHRADGSPVFHVNPGTKQFYGEYPVFHPAAIYIAFIYALEIFRYRNPLTEPYTIMERSDLDLRHYVKPEYLPKFDGSYHDYLQTRQVKHFFDEDNEDLLIFSQDLNKFIGRNHYNVYRFYLNNTVMTIEKGNDFRVIEYYRLISSHFDETTHG
jgi:hypothetical protein